MRDAVRLHREPDSPRSPAPAPGGRGPPRGGGLRPSEPAIRAPWPALALAGVLPLVFTLQQVAGDPAAVADRFGFHPAALRTGGWTGLFTELFVHAGWTHVLLNALAALAFGAPVARRFGTAAAGAAAFALFFVLCGVVASVGFALWPGAEAAVLVGASGGVAGLMGAASRMMPPATGRLAPFLSSPVLTMAAAWLAVNLLFALTGMGVGSGSSPIAWQAHLVGYAAGVVLIAPALRLARGRRAG